MPSAGGAGSAQPNFRYEPALDGLRAVAVAAVLLYHGDVSWMQGGFLGVDVFFVLSGYLITSLLLAEYTRTGTISLGAFWARRARRLLPALFLVLVGVSLYAAFVAAPGELSRIRADGLSAIVYVANWRFIYSGSSYFEQFAAPSPLRHTWSLAIEEQWYLIWPPVLLCLLRIVRGRLRVAVIAACGALVASAALMWLLYTPGLDPSRVYYGTDTRAQSLLAGALLAFAAVRFPDFLARRHRAVDGAGAVAALVLLYAMVEARGTSARLYRGGVLGFAVVGAIVVAAAVQPSGVVRRALSWSPLREIGLVSYGLYLWHWPIYVWLTPERTNLGHVALLVLRLAVTAAAAVLSFVLVERPVRYGRWTLHARARLVAPVAAGCVALVIIAATVGEPASLSNAQLAAVRRARVEAAVPVGDANRVARVFFAGDSVAFTLWRSAPLQVPYYSVYLGYGVRWFGDAHLGCGVARGVSIVDGERRPVGNCGYWTTDWPRKVAGFDPDLAVVMVGAWEVFDRVIDGRVLKVGSPAYDSYLRGELLAAVHALRGSGTRVVFTSVPCFDEPASGPSSAQRNDPRRVGAVNRAIDEVVASTPGVSVLDVGAFLCPHGRVRSTIDGVTMRGDGVHFTTAGAAVMWSWLGPRLATLAHEAAAARGHPDGRF